MSYKTSSQLTSEFQDMSLRLTKSSDCLPSSLARAASNVWIAELLAQVVLNFGTRELGIRRIVACVFGAALSVVQRKSDRSVLKQGRFGQGSLTTLKSGPKAHNVAYQRTSAKELQRERRTITIQ